MKKITEKQRDTGTFYTPDIWINNAHKYIEKYFGKNWKDEYVVFDPACGKGALTKNYKFKELYLSTLEHEDIEYLNTNNINSEAIKFQFDFLNDDDSKLPIELLDALNNKKLLILMNPPYVSARNNNKKIGEGTKGRTKNKINELMLKEKLSKGATQTYTQFFYRILNYNKLNNNITICSFTPSLYKTGSSFYKFRKLFFNSYNQIYSYIFKASHFQGLSDLWAVDFSILIPEPSLNRYEFHSYVKDIDKDGDIVIIGEKTLYNTDEYYDTMR